MGRPPKGLVIAPQEPRLRPSEQAVREAKRIAFGKFCQSILSSQWLKKKFRDELQALPITDWPSWVPQLLVAYGLGRPPQVRGETGMPTVQFSLQVGNSPPVSFGQAVAIEAEPDSAELPALDAEEAPDATLDDERIA